MNSENLENDNMKKQPTKILFILQTLRTGGSERIVKDLCENINREEFEPFVVSLLDGEMREEFIKDGIPTYCANKKGKDAFEIMRKIDKYVKSNKIDLINAHHLSPFIHAFLSAKKNRSKLLYTAHTCQEVDELRGIWVSLGKFLLKNSEGGIGISKNVSESIKTKFGLNCSKIFTIENAINISRFKIEINVEEKKRQLGFTSDDRIIGAIGSLGKQKNYPNLIKAFKLVKNEIKNAKLLIVGEGKRRSDLEKMIQDLDLQNDVILAGARLDVPELMQILEIYCLASDFEGIPLTMLEAMAAGRPIVGTNVIGIRDIVIHEKNGLLATPNDPLALCKALIKIFKSKELSKKLASNGEKYVNENHSTKKWIGKYETLFAEVMMTK